MDCGGIDRNQHVELTKSVGDGSDVETSDKFSRIRIDIVDVADVAFINVLVVVVFDLHHLIAGREGPAEAIALRRDPLTGEDHCSMADKRDPFAVTACLDPQNAKTILLVVERGALDETRQHFPIGWCMGVGFMLFCHSTMTGSPRVDVPLISAKQP